MLSPNAEIRRVGEERVTRSTVAEEDREEPVDRVRSRGRERLRNNQVVPEPSSIASEDRRHPGAIRGVPGRIGHVHRDDGFMGHGR